MWNKKRFFEYSVAVLFLLLYEILCYWFILLKTPLHGDEHHFYKTIVEFSKDLSVEKIRSYNELITPLTFIVYGFFGKLFGTDLLTVRFLSIIIGFFTHLLFFIFLKEIFKNRLIYWSLFLMWIFNPYVLGFNALVFTDGLSNFLIILFLYSVYKKKYFLIFVVSALLLYTRQFNVILIAAAVFYMILELIKKKTIDIKMIAALFAGGGAILPLLLLWEGFSPVGAMSDKLDKVSFTVYFEALPVYIYCIFIYTLPLSIIILYFNKISKYRWSLIFSATLLFYAVFPVSPSFIAVKDGFYTVGLFDKLVTFVFKDSFAKHVLLYVSFMLGSALIYLFWKVISKRGSNDVKLYDFQRFLFIYLIVFLLAMVINFQIWEKYFTQVLPAVLILIGVLLQQKLPQLSDDFKRFRLFKT